MSPASAETYPGISVDFKQDIARLAGLVPAYFSWQRTPSGDVGLLECFLHSASATARSGALMMKVADLAPVQTQVKSFVLGGVGFVHEKLKANTNSMKTEVM
jgi:hypothetical protein